MNTHAWAQTHLYEFVKKELPDKERHRIEEHIAVCKECKEEVKTFSSVLQGLDSSNVDWSAKQSPEYWNNFAFSVQNKITKEESKRNVPERFTEWIESIITFRPRDIAIASALCAVVLVVLIAGKEYIFKQVERPTSTQTMAQQATPVVDSEYLQLHDYFRRSRTLLVGLANSKMEDGDPADLQTERSMSKGLLHEARQLKQRRLDSRSERLIGDMEKIFIKVANSENEHNSPELALIRGGIERENLLYKIRRAEAMYQQPHIMFASNREN